VKRWSLAALLATLVAVSCTSGEPSEPQLRAQKPVKSIDTKFVVQSHRARIREMKEFCQEVPRACAGVYHPLPTPLKVYPRRTNALVARLREQQPSWLRYIKAIEVFSFPVPEHNVLVPPSTRMLVNRPSKVVTVRTGILVNRPGKEVGRTICDSILKPGISSVSVEGVPNEVRTLPFLASCRHPYP
jgi:hypothetical protein